MPWLWCRPVATAPIQLLAWEFPYASGMAVKKKKKEKIITLMFFMHGLIWGCEGRERESKVCVCVCVCVCVSVCVTKLTF